MKRLWRDYKKRHPNRSRCNKGLITNKTSDNQHQLSIDVTHLLSEVRNQWGFVYPFE